MAGDRRRVLFMTSNGTGLGHLTRSMAIARRLPEGVEPLFFTLSGAAPVVRQMGFHVDYMPSHDAPGAGPVRSWDRRLRRRLESILDEARPKVLVFDGAHPYPALVRTAMRRLDLVAVWSRRPLWRRGRGAAVLSWTGAFDLVMEPGELAEEEDRGMTATRRREALRLAPIVFCEEDELLRREDAEAELGLEPGRVNALVALGQGPEVSEAVTRCLARLAREPGVQVAALESSLAPELDVPPGVVRVRDTYPISRLYHAFDFAVSAAGYNAYHELIRFAVPTVFVAMPRELDDQAARARHAEALGVGLGCEKPGSERLDELLEEILDPARRGPMTLRASELEMRNGAEEAARVIGGLALERPEEAPLPTPVVERRRFLLTYAAARLSALARYPLERALRPPPRAVYDALGAGPAELARGLDRVVAECGGEPERVLVVTDAPSFAPLRRAGVAFEYLPPPDAFAAAMPELDYETVRERRLASLAGGNPRYPWPT